MLQAFFVGKNSERIGYALGNEKKLACFWKVHGSGFGVKKMWLKGGGQESKGGRS